MNICICHFCGSKRKCTLIPLRRGQPAVNACKRCAERHHAEQRSAQATTDERGWLHGVPCDITREYKLAEEYTK